MFYSFWCSDFADIFFYLFLNIFCFYAIVNIIFFISLFLADILEMHNWILHIVLVFFIFAKITYQWENFFVCFDRFLVFSHENHFWKWSKCRFSLNLYAFISYPCLIAPDRIFQTVFNINRADILALFPNPRRNHSIFHH